MRQPAFAHWPGHIAPGSRSQEVTSTMDIFMFRRDCTLSPFSPLICVIAIRSNSDIDFVLFQDNGDTE